MIRASAGNLALTWGGVALALAFCAARWVLGGFGVVTVVVTVVALWLAWVAAFDLPLATTFTRSGCERRSVLRRVALVWDDVDRLVRVAGPFARRRQGGGLFAVIGRRRTMLTDRAEQPVEFDRLRRMLGTDRAQALGLTVELRPRPRTTGAGRAER